MPRLFSRVLVASLAAFVAACAPSARQALLERVGSAVDTGRAINDAEAELLWNAPCAGSFGAALRRTADDPELRDAAIYWCDTIDGRR